MKRSRKIALWIASVFQAIVASALFAAGVLPGFLMLLCAVLINPLCLERMNRKKRIYAVLSGIGLWILSLVSISGSTGRTGDNQVYTEAESPVRIVLQSVAAEEIPIGTDPEKAAVNQAAGGAVIAQITPNEDALRTDSPKTTPSPTIRQSPSTPEPEQQTPEQKSVRSDGIEIVSYTETVGRGEYASIQIKGMPNEDYTCSVQYKTTMSAADGLGVKRSDGEGLVTWRWKVGSRTSLDYRPTIFIQGGGDSVDVRFQVVE